MATTRNDDHLALHSTSESIRPTSGDTLPQRAATAGRSTPRGDSPRIVPSSTSDATRSPTSVTSPESTRSQTSRRTRSSSTSGGKEGSGGSNRWSRSAGTSSERPLPGLGSRRMSSGTQSVFESPSRKLQKSRTQPGGSPPRQLYSSQPPSQPAPDPPSIVQLPRLQTSLGGSSKVPGSVTPSTAGILSAALRTNVPDYFGRSWDDKRQQDLSYQRSPSKSRSLFGEPSPVSAPVTTPSGGGPRYPTEEEEQSKRHSRHRTQGSKGSTGGGSSTKSPKQPSQKAMLSKALQKANIAVVLDNAQNFEGAIQAYSEACSLLQQVMTRSSGEDDRRKLEAIRNTYTTRISELVKIVPQLHNDGKALPARPEGNADRPNEPESTDDSDEAAIIETATVTRIVNDDSFVPELQQSRTIPLSQVPRRRESLLPSALEPLQFRPRIAADQPPQQYSQSSMKKTTLTLAPPMDSQYMPPPLSPRRPLSPAGHAEFDFGGDNLRLSKPTNLSASATSPSMGHRRAPSNESMSWLDTIDESGGSTTSSIHSRTSSLGVRRKRIRAPSGATEAEFDAALDAAVEAAYDDGFEPADVSETYPLDFDENDEVVANVRRRVEVAKERVRQSERETLIQDARDRERKRMLQQEQEREMTNGHEYEANESEEEERMLEEMTREYVLDDFEFGLQSKSALPRESDSSGFSGRTWNSSIGSNRTALTTVTESSIVPSVPPIQAITTSRNPGPSVATTSNTASQTTVSQSVRSRRLSGQNAKQLMIETTTKAVLPATQSSSMPKLRSTNDLIFGQPKTAGFAQRQLASAMSGRPDMPQTAAQIPSGFSMEGFSESSHLPPTPPLPLELSNENPRSGSPGRTQSRSGLRKNFSSSSLRNMKTRNLSAPNADDGSDMSPNTPMSSSFNGRDANARLPALPTLPTPIAAAFKERMNGAPTGGLYLFNSDIRSPDSPGSPDLLNTAAPIPLEPCPTELLLRPFWLMRALYQTIAHPRGGYLSTKLFIPRDVWRVKGVKIKGVEDKIANCDYLTAALLKLARVDTFDADAVLEEMQSLEGILEQVQATLSKKLGSEVGVQGSGGMFRDAVITGDVDSGTSSSKSGSAPSKSSSFSWRRLRSKNSAVGISNSYSNKGLMDWPKDGLTLPTLPMTSTSLAKVRFTKRDVTQVQFSGPNANYMGALARLFDAAQTLDQIARQVEDPGLRHADKTQVGLELCTRHAAEFFGFYICRFVLTDIGMLLDKFIKRGSEWVLV